MIFVFLFRFYWNQRYTADLENASLWKFDHDADKKYAVYDYMQLRRIVEIYKEMHVEHIRLSGNFNITVILHT